METVKGVCNVLWRGSQLDGVRGLPVMEISAAEFTEEGQRAHKAQTHTGTGWEDRGQP